MVVLAIGVVVVGKVEVFVSVGVVVLADVVGVNVVVVSVGIPVDGVCAAVVVAAE